MEKIIVLNHKMKMLYDDVYSYIEKTNNLNTNSNLIICPSSLYLESFVNSSTWAIGAQNLDYHLDVNHTGKISSNQLKSMGVYYVILGHSECLEKDYDVINLKLKAALDSNIMPILCIGETDDKNFSSEIIEKLDYYLKDIVHIEFITFAYEPIYMIGSDLKLEIDTLKNKINFLYENLKKRYNITPTIIYGGNVNSDNIKQIMEVPNLNGVLIGSKSADFEKLEEIIKKID